MDTTRLRSILAISFLLATVLSTAHAVTTVGPGAFPAGSTVITFDGLLDGTEVNGLSVGSVLFNYNLGNGQVIIDGGPGVTDNISPPNVVSIGNNTGTLTLTLGGLFDTFGFGYAILNTTPVLNATTITLFSGAANVGTLSYNGVPDPSFTGGFAGIRSTIPFDVVQMTFNSTDAPAFALDNIRLATAIPEPSTAVLIVTGALAFWWRRRKSIDVSIRGALEISLQRAEQAHGAYFAHREKHGC
jgi:hypothetical protein